VVRALDVLVVSGIARVEVPAAIWRKERAGDLDAADAEVLTAAFEADWFGTEGEPPRFAAIGLSPELLDGAAAETAAHGLRAYDAVQLASALAAREGDPDCHEFACFDDELRVAAARSGFSLVPYR
jgi:hypothetical protein